MGNSYNDDWRSLIQADISFWNKGYFKTYLESQDVNHKNDEGCNVLIAYFLFANQINPRVVELILQDESFKINERADQPFCMAALFFLPHRDDQAKLLPIYEMLLDKGADVNMSHHEA